VSILQVEDAIIAAARAVLGTHVRDVESLPGEWDDEMLKRLLRAVPGCFVAFAGGPRNVAAGGVTAAIDGRWVVYTVTGHASGEAARRRGDSRQVGAYELLGLLAPHLHGLVVAGVGTLQLVDLQNVYSGTVDRQGLAVYALTFGIPMTLDLPVDGTLTPSETFAAAWDTPPHTPQRHADWLDGDDSGGAPDARDQVALPQS